MEPRATRLLRRPRLLIVGCGDVGLRVLRVLQGRWRVFALTHSPSRRELLRAAGAVPLVADLDDAASLARLARLADAVLPFDQVLAEFAEALAAQRPQVTPQARSSALPRASPGPMCAQRCAPSAPASSR